MGSRRSALMPLVLIGAMLAMLLILAPPGSSGPTDVKTSVFFDHAASGEYTEVLIKGTTVIGLKKDKTAERAYITDRKGLYDELRTHKVAFNDSDPVDWTSYIWMFLPLALVIFLVLMIGRTLRNANGGGGGMLSRVQKSKAIIIEKTVPTRFTDVAGAEEAVEECRELVDFLKDPKRFGNLGGSHPKGIILIGPSGTGKTLLARAVAGEAGVPFLLASGSSFVEMFVGVGAARVRDLFEDGRKRMPCIIFIDEIDAVGQKRGGIGRTGGHDEREQTLNELLVQLDGFEASTGIIVMAATNRPEVLDSALLRPGRFDRQVTVPVPDLRGRLQILKVHAVKYKLAEDADLEVIARGTPGMTGADLANLLNEASLYAGKHRKKAIGMSDLEYAKDKVMMGPERKSQALSPQELLTVAYHECGHALTAWFTPEADPLHKVTVIPRGQALGLTMSLPLEDRKLYRKTWILAQIKLLMGGRVAEELFFGDVTSGASDDLTRATDLARKMVVDLGMSDLGNRTFGRKDRGMFLDYGGDMKDFGEDTQRAIDETIDRILKDAYEFVKSLISTKKDLLDTLAKALLEKETLDNGDVAVILGPRPTDHKGAADNILAGVFYRPTGRDP